MFETDDKKEDDVVSDINVVNVNLSNIDPPEAIRVDDYTGFDEEANMNDVDGDNEHKPDCKHCYSPRWTNHLLNSKNSEIQL